MKSKIITCSSGLRLPGIAFILFFLAFLPVAHADPAQEIGHLLQYIERSGCVFIRNGRQHNSTEALEHIRKKYGYVKKRVEKAEDFIRYAATGSSMTGSPYLVRCADVEMSTADWLRAELARFRNFQ